MDQIEIAIRSIVHGCVETFANTFAEKHVRSVGNPKGSLNMKMHNVFIAALGNEIQYYSALSRSLDSSLGNMLETMALSIARLNYKVSEYVDGVLYLSQIEAIARLLEEYKRHAQKPDTEDYKEFVKLKGESVNKRHDSDYYIVDETTNRHYLIELKIGGDLDNKKARSEKEALLEQYCILSNRLGSSKDVKIMFATAYNRYGEGRVWRQGRVMQFFAPEELCIGKDFWNFVCKRKDGYDIVLSQYREDAHLIVAALNDIKDCYLSDED